MNLHYYETKSGRKPVKEYINALPEQERVDGYSVLEYLENGEWEKVKTKQWYKKIYEIYFYKHNRIFYVISDGENIYLMHACRKQKNKTEKRDKKIVMSRAKELEGVLGKDFV